MDPEIEDLKRQISKGMKQVDALLRILTVTERCCQDDALRNLILRFDELENKLTYIEHLAELSSGRINHIEEQNSRHSGKLIDLEEREASVQRQFDANEAAVQRQFDANEAAVQRQFDNMERRRNSLQSIVESAGEDIDDRLSQLETVTTISLPEASLVETRSSLSPLPSIENLRPYPPGAIVLYTVPSRRGPIQRRGTISGYLLGNYDDVNIITETNRIVNIPISSIYDARTI